MVNLTAVCIADIFSILLAFMTLGARLWRDYQDEHEKKRIQGMLYTVIVASFSDMLSFLFDKTPGVLGFIAVYGFNLILYFSNLFIGTLWVILVIKHISNRPLPKAQLVLATSLDVIGTIVLLLNSFVPIVYNVDYETNEYSRGPLFWLFIAIEFILVIDGIIVYFIEKRRHPDTVYFPIWQYIIPLFLSVGIQSFIYGVSTIWPGISIAISAIVFGMYNQQENEKEILRQRESIIKQLSDDYDYVCYIDLEKQEITAEYLSGHLNVFIAAFGTEETNESKSELFDKVLNAAVVPEDLEKLKDKTFREAVMNELMAKGTYSVDFRIRGEAMATAGVIENNEDNCVWYRLKMSIDEKRKHGAVLGVFSIDSEKKASEALAKAYKAAEAANEAKTKFLFNMSHDIRTPMNAIIGYNNMAAKNLGVDDEKVRDCLAKCDKASGLLLNLINDVLEMSRIESGKIEIAENECDVMNVFTETESLLRNLAAENQLDLSFSIGEIRDRYVIYDYTHTNRILVNIINNAIKYTTKGGWIKVACEQIEGKSADMATFKFTVEDNGIGMSEEFQKHLFEHFSRERTATVSHIQGTGLGLALCKSLSDAMGAEIFCESKKDVGTKFTFILPCKKSAIARNDEAKDKQENGENGQFEGKKILVVEDNEMNREIACDILEDNGFVIDNADDGTTAVAKLKEKGPDYFDAILMDIQMPIMDGYAATAEIRKMYPDSPIIIIALSANAFEEDKKKSIAAGMNDHISKPINVAELNKTLAKYL